MAASQRLVAGVSIDERLSVGAYGAVHKAHTSSRRDLRALVVDARLAGESSFQTALFDEQVKSVLTSFDHPAIVPTLSIARTGDELVVVTVGPGRHATVAELLGAANGASRGKLTVEVAGSIVQSVVQALAAAHQRGLVHGAVHARSVAIDDAGHVKLCDFAVGRALTAAVAQGADGQLARGLTGSLPPELVLGEPPSPAGDVFAAGALLFTMLSGEAPPGALRVTPAVEKVVQRALDTDPARRFRDGTELLEALLEAYDDDRWTLADSAELRKLVLGKTPAPVSANEGNLDDDTEDLLASLGSAARNVPLTRPSVDIRAAAVAERQRSGGKAELDALLADLDPKEELTAVDDMPRHRDPISEIIRLDDARTKPRPASPMIPAPRPTPTPAPERPATPERDDFTPLPPPSVGDDSGQLLAAAVRGKAKQRAAAPTVPHKPGRASSPVAADLARDDGRPKRNDEIAALSAIADLDGRVDHTPARPAPAPSARGDSEGEDVAPSPPKAKPKAATVARARPVSAMEPALADDAPPIRLKSRFWPIVWTVLILGGLGAGVFYYLDQKKQRAAAEAKKDEAAKKADQAALEAREAQDDPGNVVINSEPGEAAVYMLLGRTPMDFPHSNASVSLGLPTSQLHIVRIELDSYTPIDMPVPGNLWSLDQGEDKLRVAKLAVPLKVAETDSKGRPKVVLPFQPDRPPPAIEAGPFPPGRGVIHVETTPPNAAVWLWIGSTNNARFDNLVAGRDYEFRVLKDGYLPGYLKISAEEWRAQGTDPKIPLSTAKKEETLTRSVTLTIDPKAPKPK
jgi:serine/threonine protein kinase